METEEKVGGVKEEMLRETGKIEMEGDQILPAQLGHHRAEDWALKRWKNSL